MISVLCFFGQVSWFSGLFVSILKFEYFLSYTMACLVVDCFVSIALVIGLYNNGSVNCYLDIEVCSGVV